jgi:hypothetical protein
MKNILDDLRLFEKEDIAQLESEGKITPDEALTITRRMM